MIFGVFILVLGVLVVIGMIKGFIVMFVVFGWIIVILGMY